MELPKLGVSELVKLINTSLSLTMPEVLVEGEISNYSGANQNGHHYFTIKDSEADVKCVIFAGKSINLQIENGMKVILRAQPNLHNKYGFSLLVSHIKPSGEGELKKALELTKKKLLLEGLFSPQRKRPIPHFPETIGLVTSSSAAAYTDVLNILKSRWPLARVIHAQTGVQGDDAPEAIAAAVDAINQAMPDVILLVRGGGSLEDLAAFSAEEVVRAVVRSRAPVVTGIGHERDESLVDLAADLKTNTPTDAAQKATPDAMQVSNHLDASFAQLIEILLNNLQRAEMQVDNSIGKLGQKIEALEIWLKNVSLRLAALDPKSVLKKGYAIVKMNNQVLASTSNVSLGDIIDVSLSDGQLSAEVKDVKRQ